MSGPRSTDTQAPGGRQRPPAALPLEALVAASGELEGVRRRDLAVGDRLVVSTRNSIYSLVAREDGRFNVSGGWFERHGGGERTLAVNGCTVGGHALLTDLVAAPGLFLEFGDGTKTTRIRRVRRLPAALRAAS
ncbi:MAG TPA: hypothetical protein VGC00_05865 [Thermoanaerobaculia bacterium]|jgi:hypothetical protein